MKNKSLYTFDEEMVLKAPKPLKNTRKCRDCSKKTHKSSYWFCADHIVKTQEWEDGDDFMILLPSRGK